MQWRIFAAPDELGQGGSATGAPETPVADGQGGGEPAQPVGPASSGQAPQEPFFQIEDEAGKSVPFHTQDELKEWIQKNGPMLRSDYSRKTQSLKKQQEDFERQRKEFEAKSAQLAEFEKYDQFVRNNPHVYQQLKQMMQRPMGGQHVGQVAQDYAKQAVDPVMKELEELKAWREQQEQEAQEREIAERLKAKYEDFDEDAISELISTIDPDNLESLYETLYFASRGRQRPAEMERRIAEAQKRKQQSGVLPASGGDAPPAKPPAGSIDEMRERARRAVMRGG